ncbi:hypothetical protein RvY_09752 [Ramazzottius varieornatus]|uniref:Uncharacterized protein n=1 Tax=Ramazzottius varieornatus TaxID=947166 RepID=A0A1D1VI95_RAMVA|nr:hypothetical protein RvY_09752 [Ramazzottius varieornatus]
MAKSVRTPTDQPTILPSETCTHKYWLCSHQLAYSQCNGFKQQQESTTITLNATPTPLTSLYNA